jgi:hypothetical protein
VKRLETFIVCLLLGFNHGLLCVPFPCVQFVEVLEAIGFELLGDLYSRDEVADLSFQFNRGQAPLLADRTPAS